MRNPFHNYSSLNKKLYGNESGQIDDKFIILEKIFNAREIFDLVILFEDFMFHPTKVLKELNQLDLKQNRIFFSLREQKDMVKFNLEHSNWCKEFYQKNDKPGKYF